MAVWHWDEKENNARARILIITRAEEKNPKIKYSFSKGVIDKYTKEEYAYSQ
ncbi:MAG: hypothetical protein Q8904_08920 [Bacteroidota bacterium]|nr:hypothetical protein [Bacteroidota bacterium]